MTENDFHTGLMMPVHFSVAISKIAVEKATNPLVAEFAAMELAEVTAASNVLKELGSLVPEMDEATNNSFNEIQAATGNIQFDQLYIDWQLQNHQLMRDLTEDYLNDAPTDDLDPEEAHGKHLAMLMLPNFDAHITIAQRLQQELKA